MNFSVARITKLLFTSVLVSVIFLSVISNPQIYGQERPVRVYVEELPTWGSNAAGSIEKAFKYWGEKKGAQFTIVDINNRPDVMIQWVKDFGHKRAGHAVFKQFVEVGIGDSHCDGNWNPWHPTYVTNVVTHEIGHTLGFGHEEPSDSIMNSGGRGDWGYQKISDTYNQIEGYFTFFPTCMNRDAGVFNYAVKSLDEKTFDVYFVKSYDQLKQASQGLHVDYYEGCFAVDQTEVSGQCKVNKGSGLMIRADKSTSLSITLAESISPKNYKIYSEKPPRSFDLPTPTPQTPSPPDTRVSTEFIYIENLSYPILEGERRIITGKFDELHKNVDLAMFSASLPNSKIILKNSTGHIIGTDITDVNGKFRFVWETPFANENSKITFGTFSEILTLEYEGDEKYAPSSHHINHTVTLRGDYYDETKHGIISVNNDGEIRIEQNQYSIPKYEISVGVKVAGKVYSDYVRGTKVFVSVIKPDETAEEHAIRILQDGTFGTSLLLQKDSPKGWHEVRAKSLDKELGPVWFKVVEKQNIQTLFLDENHVPKWIKNNAAWWAEGQISDSTFVSGIEYMIKEEILKIPNIPPTSSGASQEQQIPSWLRTNAKWWAEGQIPDNEFLSGIKHLIENGIIRIPR